MVLVLVSWLTRAAAKVPPACATLTLLPLYALPALTTTGGAGRRLRGCIQGEGVSSPCGAPVLGCRLPGTVRGLAFLLSPCSCPSPYKD